MSLVPLILVHSSNSIDISNHQTQDLADSTEFGPNHLLPGHICPPDLGYHFHHLTHLPTGILHHTIGVWCKVHSDLVQEITLVSSTVVDLPKEFEVCCCHRHAGCFKNADFPSDQPEPVQDRPFLPPRPHFPRTWPRVSRRLAFFCRRSSWQRQHFLAGPPSLHPKANQQRPSHAKSNYA